MHIPAALRRTYSATLGRILSGSVVVTGLFALKDYLQTPNLVVSFANDDHKTEVTLLNPTAAGEPATYEIGVKLANRISALNPFKPAAHHIVCTLHFPANVELISADRPEYHQPRPFTRQPLLAADMSRLDGPMPILAQTYERAKGPSYIFFPYYFSVLPPMVTLLTAGRGVEARLRFRLKEAPRPGDQLQFHAGYSCEGKARRRDGNELTVTFVPPTQALA